MLFKLVVALCVTLFIFQSGNAFAPRSAFSKSMVAVNKAMPSITASRLLRMAVTDAPPKVDSMAMGGGMFTNSSPETKRVVPTNTEGKTKFKVVYVVLESQYQSALTKACNSINAGKEGVAVEAVGYLLEELRNPAVLEQFKADVASANIFIGSLIFVQELADKVSSMPIYTTYISNRVILISSLSNN